MSALECALGCLVVSRFSGEDKVKLLVWLEANNVKAVVKDEEGKRERE